MRLDCGICVVRDWRREDKASLVRHADSRAVWRNLQGRFPHPYTESDADEWFDFLATIDPPRHWAIDVDGDAVGGIGVVPRSDVFVKSAEFGYWLGDAFWGRGIMTAAVRGIVEHLMAELDVVRLEARVYAWNPASMRVLEKCGFVREGWLRRSIFKDGEIIDSALYARVIEGP